jgi:hypothetical protein
MKMHMVASASANIVSNYCPMGEELREHTGEKQLEMR